ncbi:hypothetical protein [Paenibacillus sp. 1781tsa1]|uniref:hypothetical protein n=1 Tax=Paenibacillus sp. 1781tsa1 TaxID=2953810 RepID=UPI00345FCFC0
MFEAPLQLEVFKSDNAKGQTDYNNPEVDELLTEASVNLDDQKREVQYQKVQSILAEERPRIFLYQNKFNYGVGNRIDFTPRADEMFFAEDITLKE